MPSGTSGEIFSDARSQLDNPTQAPVPRWPRHVIPPKNQAIRISLSGTLPRGALPMGASPIPAKPLPPKPDQPRSSTPSKYPQHWIKFAHVTRSKKKKKKKLRTHPTVTTMVSLVAVQPSAAVKGLAGSSMSGRKLAATARPSSLCRSTRRYAREAS